MKQFILSITVGLLVWVSAVALAQFQNEPDGFRGLKWGTRLSDVASALNFVEEDSGVKFYSRKGDSLKLGDADVVAVKYGFWQDKFYTVQILYRGDTSDRLVRQHLFKEYGEGRSGTSREAGATILGWGGYTASVLYKYFPSSTEGRVVISSSVTLRERRGAR